MPWGFEPAWGIFDQNGGPVFLADAVASVEYHNNWLISDYPQEQGAFTSYNKVKTPYDAKVTFLTGSDYFTRAGFLEALEAATASLDLFVIVTPEISYPNANLTFFTYHRSARSGATLLRVEVWAKEIRLVQSGVLSNTQSPNGADKQNNGAVQPQNTGPNGSPNLKEGLSSPSSVTPSTGLQTTNVGPSFYDATNLPKVPNTYDELAVPQQQGIINFGQKNGASTATASSPTNTGHSYVTFGGNRFIMASQVVRVNSEGVVDGSGVLPLVGVPAAFVFTDTGVNVDGAQLIPLQPVNSQQLTITLNSQNCTLLVYTKHIWVPFVPSGGIKTDPPIYEPIDPIFLDLYINDSLLLGGVLCLNENLIVRNSYFGFIGDLSFLDTTGNEDPQVSGLGDRWQLAYWPNL